MILVRRDGGHHGGQLPHVLDPDGIDPSGGGGGAVMEGMAGEPSGRAPVWQARWRGRGIGRRGFGRMLGMLVEPSLQRSDPVLERSLSLVQLEDLLLVLPDEQRLLLGDGHRTAEHRFHRGQGDDPKR